jgi:hypothetical protein
MSRRQYPEDQIQRAVFEHFALRAAPGVFAFHPPNGGWRSRVEAAIFKGLGACAGVPDVIAIKGGHTFALEQATRSAFPWFESYQAPSASL